MIKDTTNINTRTHEGRLALALLAVVTTTTHKSKTPDDVITAVQPLISHMFEGEPEATTEGLAGVATNKLVRELRARDGVQSIEVDHVEPYHIEINNYEDYNDTGPALILVVTD